MSKQLTTRAQEIQDLLAKNMKASEVAKTLGISRQRVYQCMANFDLEHKKLSQMIEERRDTLASQMLPLVEEGLDDEAIAEKLNVSVSMIVDARLNRDIKRNIRIPEEQITAVLEARLSGFPMPSFKKIEAMTGVPLHRVRQIIERNGGPEHHKGTRKPRKNG